MAARRGAAECHRGRDFSFSGAFQEANEIQDGQLEERASLLTVALMETGSHRYVPSEEPDGKVVVQKLGNTASDRLLHFPGAFTDDIQTRVIDGRKWPGGQDACACYARRESRADHRSRRDREQ